MIFKQHRCIHELQFVNHPNAGDLRGIFGNLRDCNFHNKVYCIKCGFNFRIKDGTDIKFVVHEKEVPTHKEFQKAIDKAGLRGYEFKDGVQKGDEQNA